MKKHFSIYTLMIVVGLCIGFSRTAFSQANTELSNLVSPTKVNVNLLPQNDNAKNLGSAAKSWKNVYMSGLLYLDGSRFMYGSGSNTGLGYSALASMDFGLNNTAIGNGSMYSSISGYSNTATGDHSLYLNTSGSSNTAIGTYSMYSNTLGSWNAAIGDHSLTSNTTGEFNTAFGTSSMFDNTAGNYNTANGYGSLQSNTTGNYNTANGSISLLDNSTGNANTATGYAALLSNTSGNSNTAMGIRSLYLNTDRSNLVAIGDSALFNNGTGASSSSHATANTAVGSKALFSNTTGYGNNGNGYQSLYSNSTGYSNTADGDHSLYSNTTGNYNASYGKNSLYSNTTSSYNTANGYRALYENTGGSNTASGYGAGSYNDNNTSCTFLGYDADQSVSTDFSNSSALGNTSRITASNQVRLGNSSVTSIGGYVSWSNISDGRYKKQVLENVPGLEFINKLKPVTYHLDATGISKFLGESVTDSKDMENAEKAMGENAAADAGSKGKEQIVYTGFIAQDVESAAKEIGYDFSGVDKPQNESSLYGLRYAEFVVPLVKAVQELSSKNEELKTRLENLESLMGLNDQIKILNEEQQTVELKGIYAPSLGQNSPNPFNNTTVISYNVPQKDAKVQMQFVAVTGEVLQTIELSSGNSNVTVKASELPAGTYQYSLVVNGNIIATKNMNLIK